MEIKQLIPGQTNHTILYDSYAVKGLRSFNELIDLYKEYQQNNPGKTVILTLDDLGQAEYTSMHATMSHDLDSTEGYDLSGIDPACFEDGEHLGYLSTPSEFFMRKENFMKQLKELDFSAVCAKGLTLDEDEMSMLEEINQVPFGYIYMDKQTILQVVPVERYYEAICGFPNGYFSSDLNPFENYALAKYLSEKYGFELFGIGSTVLGFISNEKLDEEQAEALISDLSKLYNVTEEDLFDNFIEIIQESEFLFLKYVEYLEEWTPLDN